MKPTLTHRKATIDDLPHIIELLAEDELGATREHIAATIDPRYTNAFRRIDSDPNQYLMLVLSEQEIIGTCHLTLMPSLTFTGTTRLQIEAVRISAMHRGQRIGEWMITQAIEYGRSHGAGLIQLTTNQQRTKARLFYERLGFKVTHDGMKLYL